MMGNKNSHARQKEGFTRLTIAWVIADDAMHLMLRSVKGLCLRNNFTMPLQKRLMIGTSMSTPKR